MAIHINPEHRGRLHRALNIPMDKKIPYSRLQQAAKSKNIRLKKEAIFAENAREWNHR